MSAEQAKICFTDSLNYINSKADPVNYDFAQGLLAIAESLAQLEADVRAIKSAVGHLEHP
jgi:hypothetical protein